MITKVVKRIIKKEKFHPGLIGFFINHNFFIRKAIKSAIKKNADHLSGDLLDFGCGTKPYKELFTKCNKYVGVDYKIEGREEKQKEVDVFYDGKRIPFEEDTFDSILCTEVLEHVFNIDELLLEFKRVLKTDGKIIVTTPFMWEEHEMPYDFARYTTPALNYLYTKHGFIVVCHSKTGNYIEVIAQFSINYFKNIFPKNTIIKHFLLLPIVFFYNFFGTVFGFLLPKDKTAYFNNVFVLQKAKEV